jgi:glycosyltransferase involved in cell wall biosynthesis
MNMGNISVAVPSYEEEEIGVVIPSYETDKISIIIPSCKEEIATLDSLDSCPVGFEVIVSKVSGLGRCRNYGVRKAQHDFIVMFDDDIVVSPEIWHHVLNVKRGEFAMAFLSGFPCSRVVAVHAEDFWRIGGFDESIKFTGEDRDFYVRALEAGLRFKLVPLSLVYHVPHTVRARNIHVAVQAVKENMVFLRRYWRRHPKVFKVDFFDRLKHGQARTLLLEFFWFFILQIKDWGTLTN